MDLKDISEETLKLRLRSTEHDFVERKAKNDRQAWLQTAVAFANSVPIGLPAYLFVGVDDEGNPQLDAAGLESQMKSVSDTLDRAFPPIYRHIVPLHLDGGCCLAVIVPGSDVRPHFAGQSYVRIGEQTKAASEQQFANLLDQRLSKTRELMMWKSKYVTVETVVSRLPSGALYPEPGRKRTPAQAVLIDCNQFYVTVEVGGKKQSHALRNVELSFDHAENRIKVEVYD
jgi:hypothetical protein